MARLPSTYIALYQVAKNCAQGSAGIFHNDRIRKPRFAREGPSGFHSRRVETKAKERARDVNVGKKLTSK
jgi:hypothetical protein